MPIIIFTNTQPFKNHCKICEPHELIENGKFPHKHKSDRAIFMTPVKEKEYLLSSNEWIQKYISPLVQNGEYLAHIDEADPDEGYMYPQVIFRYVTENVWRIFFERYRHNDLFQNEEIGDISEEELLEVLMNFKKDGLAMYKP